MIQQVLHVSLKLHFFPKSGTKSYLSAKEDHTVREGDQSLCSQVNWWAVSGCLLRYAALGKSLSNWKTLFLLAIWMQLVSLLSWGNLSSNMNTVTKGKYRSSLRSSVIFCGKKKEALKRFFFCILSLKQMSTATHTHTHKVKVWV